MYRPGTDGWRAIVAAFGRDILHCDGSISRQKLAGIVFSDESARARLNAIVHPQVRQLLSDQVARARRQGARVVVVEVPLLVEAIRSAPSWTRMFDEVWVVTAPEAQVIDRVREPRAEGRRLPVCPSPEERGGPLPQRARASALSPARARRA